MLGDRFAGCLLWGAIGDALGRPVEGQSPAAVRDCYPAGLSRYVPWPGWRGGPRGTITDDTQLTMLVAQSLQAMGGRADPADLARRLVAWLPGARGIGVSTAQVVGRIAQGEGWWQASQQVASAGNGAAMRAAPVGLAWALHPSPDPLVQNAVRSALPTHSHPVGVAGAVVMAAAVAWLVRAALSGVTSVQPDALVAFLAATINGLEPDLTPERRPGGRAIRLSDRIRELPGLLALPPAEAFAITYNGALALEAVPAALYCFLRSPSDPAQAIETAVHGGYDADTVASMAGNLAGAWCGAERLRHLTTEWYAELEYRQELEALARALVALAVGQGKDVQGWT